MALEFMTMYLDHAAFVDGGLGHGALGHGALAEVVVRAESDDEGWGRIGLLLFLAGPVFFAMKYFKYRNTDKRHRHEAETKAEMANVMAGDEFVQSMTGLRNSRMPKANHNAVRGARTGSAGSALDRIPGISDLRDQLGG